MASAVTTLPSNTSPRNSARAAFSSLGSGGTSACASGRPGAGPEAANRWGPGTTGPRLPPRGLAMAGAGPRRGGGDLRQDRLQPVAEGGLEACHVERLEDPVQGGDTGGAVAAKAEPTRQVGGVVAAPLGDGVEALAAAQHGADGQGQD